MSADLLEAVSEIVDRGDDSDEVLQAVVSAIVDKSDAKWAAVLLDADGELVVGPHAGIAEPEERRTAPIVLARAHLGELAVDGLDDQPMIDRLAALVAPYCTHQEDAT